MVRIRRTQCNIIMRASQEVVVLEYRKSLHAAVITKFFMVKIYKAAYDQITNKQQTTGLTETL